MKYRVRHHTLYTYATPVDLASHMLHLLPRVLPHQAVISARVLAAPTPSRTSSAEDHFGNRVTWLFMDLPHDRFEVTAEATLDVLFPLPPAAAETLPWEQVAAMARGAALGPGGDNDGAWRAAEFTFDSPMIASDPAAAAYAAASFPAGRPVLAGLLELNGRVRRDFAFRPGATSLHTPVSRVMAQRAGVCQDFAHMMISGLRSLGLPSRYVSGYLRTRPPPGGVKRRGADQSHAWVGCWLGPRHGWVDLDPTNDLVVRDEHVVLGWGRDYGDVSPVRGMILGGGKHGMTVGVDLEPV
jgi:transglutaminase-like putative cysteine protease